MAYQKRDLTRHVRAGVEAPPLEDDLVDGLVVKILARSFDRSVQNGDTMLTVSPFRGAPQMERWCTPDLPEY
jgi:hypothetical protein